MKFRFKMNYSAHVFGQRHSLRILRAREQKLVIRQSSCWGEEKLFELCLPVGGVGAHVTEIAFVSEVGLAEPVAIRIERAIERHSASRAEPALDFAQQWAAGETEIQIETGDLITAQIFAIALAELGYGDG